MKRTPGLRQLYNPNRFYTRADVRRLTNLGRELVNRSDDVAWVSRAECKAADPELFFSDAPGASKFAKMICSQCVVRTECLATALWGDERFGVWGGMDAGERRKLKSR